MANGLHHVAQGIPKMSRALRAAFEKFESGKIEHDILCFQLNLCEIENTNSDFTIMRSGIFGFQLDFGFLMKKIQIDFIL